VLYTLSEYPLLRAVNAITMHTDPGTQIPIQILATTEDAGRAGRAIAVATDRVREIADIARDHAAQALLVCPAPDEFTSDGSIDLVIGARFAGELDEDELFWRQQHLSRDIFHALRIEALVIDLDRPLDAFLKHIQPMLALPYRDEIGSRSSSTFPGV
jgi:hypothetical protein